MKSNSVANHILKGFYVNSSQNSKKKRVSKGYDGHKGHTLDTVKDPDGKNIEKLNPFKSKNDSRPVKRTI